MTGFGAADGRVGAARVSVEVRTVNHRFFTPTMKLPGSFARWEGDVREALRKRIARGHVSLFARIERDATTTGPEIDQQRVAQWVQALRELQQRHGLEGTLDLATVMRMPDVLAAREEEDPGSVAELVTIVDEAIAALMRMREEEGRALATLIGSRLDLVEAALRRIAARGPERLAAQRERLQARVAELAGGIAVEPQRLAQELAVLAERLDVAEEMDRFESHIREFRRALGDSSGEPVGKRLGFLLQEMLREANTTGSKANDAPIQHEVVGIKEELERIREQVENLE